ncbi:pyridoxal-phosphate dependent enzyme [Chitinispirillales bacterium ANBcel5]|uniref:1-aminocyclopropane-1-carboxylate deaminase/D-cysteine desulfhydrase n=1 Tax=Cellulosispirillum alkaliphilum TaxID=3039283 RepID=UPI002A546D7E|nr:pyridoxal-phosphate dependent enzyme [Chitinispirillales bacterium ANBcel5]
MQIDTATPIQKLKHKINKNAVFIKRDDLIPFSFGGNKARKALLFFEELQKQQCDCVVTYGSSSSNHCRIVANMAASKGLRCVIISPIQTDKSTYNSTMLKLFGAQIVHCHISQVSVTINQTLDKLKCEGYKPYFIEGGGHGNIGTKAYVEAYKEIQEYESDNDLCFDYIFHTSGTGTTQAGLICGKIINKDKKSIIGISCARKNPYGEQVIFDSVNSYLKSIEKECAKSDLVNFIDDYVLDGYGRYNNEILLTIKTVLTEEGIPLDTTYTGKGFWGMQNYVEKNQITGKTVLFIHTGGTPLFFNDLGEVAENE